MSGCFGEELRCPVVIAGMQGWRKCHRSAYPVVLLDSVSAVRETGDSRMPSLCIRS
jgi:hypothetical protein